MLLFDKSDSEGTQFSLMKSLVVLGKGKDSSSTTKNGDVDEAILQNCRVLNLTLSPQEDVLVATTSDHRMLTMNFTGKVLLSQKGQGVE